MEQLFRMVAKFIFLVWALLTGSLAWSQIEIERVSVSSEGVQAAGISRAFSVSDDGNIITFTAVDDSLAPGYSNPYDFGFAYFRNVAEPLTDWVSLPTSVSRFPQLPVTTGDGGRIYFISNESGLPGIEDTSSDAFRLFYRDTTSGQIELVLDTATSDCFGIEDYLIHVSQGGARVSFRAPECFINAGGSTEGRPLWIYDSVDDVTSLVSRDEAGSAINAGPVHTMSANGQWVAFWTTLQADGLGADTSNPKLYVMEVDQDQVYSVPLVDSSQHGGWSQAQSASITNDGKYVTFHSGSADLIGSDTNGRVDTFLVDRGTEIVTRVSTTASGNQVDFQHSYYVDMTPDGSRIVYSADGKIILWDRDIDQKFNLVEGVASRGLAISADGRYVLTVMEDDQIGGDTNGVPDVVRIDLDGVYYLFSDRFE